jgi:hypothetical protein
VGATYVLRVGAQGSSADAALVSAMIVLGENGPDVLWATPAR